MADPTGIRMLLDKLKLQLAAFQQMLKAAPADQEPPQHHNAPDAAESIETDTGLPLEIGNELLITDEIIKKYRGLSNSLGRVVIVDAISVEDGEAIKASAFGIQLQVDMKGAWHMREAYLRREQAWSAT